MAGADYSVGSSEDCLGSLTHKGVKRGARMPSRRLVIDEVDFNPFYSRQNPFNLENKRPSDDDRDDFTEEIKDMFSTLPPDELTQKLPDLMTKWINSERIPLTYLLQQTPDIAQKAIENSERVAALKDVVGEYLIPLVVRNIEKQCARLALIKLINGGYVSKLEAEIKICPTILALTSQLTTSLCDFDIELDCFPDLCNVESMSKLAPILGIDITERILLNRFMELCTSKHKEIRKEAAKNIGYFCATVSTSVFEKCLLPCYLALCQDEIPSIRMYCADNIIYISCVCPPELRKTLLTKTLINLLNDAQYVGLWAFNSLGAFIVTFANPSLISIQYDDTTGDLMLVNQSKTEFKPHYSLKLIEDEDYFYEQPDDVIPYLRKKNVIDITKNSIESDVNKLDSLSNGRGMFNNSLKVEQQKHEDDLLYYNDCNYWYINPSDIEISVHNKLKMSKKDAQSNKVMRVGLEELYSTMSLSDNFGNDTNKSVLSSFETDNIDQKGINIDIKNRTECNAAQEIVPHELIESFISLSSECPEENRSLDHIRVYILPAVLLTLGKESWPLFKETVRILAEHGHDDIKLTIASSLHDLAVILGPKMADDLILPFEILFKELYFYQVKLLDNLPRFFEVISPEKRLFLLAKLYEVINGDLKIGYTMIWKRKELFLRQLSLMVKFFEPTEILNHIGRYAQLSMGHHIAFIRNAAVKLVSSVVKNIVVDRGLTSSYLVAIAERYAHSKKWRRRQTFALLCSVLLREQTMDSEDFASILWPHLLDLSWDPIPNVRMLVAKCIVENLVINEYFIQERLESLKSVLRRLQADKDGDVRLLASCSSV